MTEQSSSAPDRLVRHVQVCVTTQLILTFRDSGCTPFRRHSFHFRPFVADAEVPWKECNVHDESLRCVAHLLDDEKMAAPRREFGISRKTVYKIFNRYKDPRPRRPDRPRGGLAARLR